VGVFLVCSSALRPLHRLQRLDTALSVSHLAFQVLLGYSMILLLMEDAKARGRRRTSARYPDRLPGDAPTPAHILADPCIHEVVGARHGAATSARSSSPTSTTQNVPTISTATRCDQLIRSCAEVLRGVATPHDKLYPGVSTSSCASSVSARPTCLAPSVQRHRTLRSGPTCFLGRRSAADQPGYRRLFKLGASVDGDQRRTARCTSRTARKSHARREQRCPGLTPELSGLCVNLIATFGPSGLAVSAAFPP